MNILETVAYDPTTAILAAIGQLGDYAVIVIPVALSVSVLAFGARWLWKLGKRVVSS
jgi:predicted tellurium resistance membrane protein TerC